MKLSISILIMGLCPFWGLSQNNSLKPYGALPSERQLKWHEMEMYCLIHFTPTTFQDKEWGFGDADPVIFNPTSFDANQIAAAAAAAGFKGLISVAKHHDGFCLWPTKTTTYSIASSPWRDGKGDMVEEFRKASVENGLDFGVYLSAWDRNDTRYGSPAYADAYREQLTELMTNYGPLFTSWHDGANGGDGYYGGKNEKRTIDRSTYYEWDEKTWPIVRRLQPMAMIFSDVGPDMRWVGNEHGFANETSWATFTPTGIDGRKPVPGDSDYKQSPAGNRNGKFWIPAECDVPQRLGWFYHKNQDNKVKNPEELFEIYLKSVGRGANMNLGLAPMPEGYLHPNDVKSLAAFGTKLNNTFAKNLAKGATLKASDVRGKNKEYDVNNILDEDRYSFYAPNDDILTPSIEVNLKGAKEFDIIRLRENIKLGQRLDSVQVEIYHNGHWKKIASATSIGANRLIKLDSPIKAERLRLNLFAPVVPTLSEFALFKEFSEPFSFDPPVTDRIALDPSGYRRLSPILEAPNNSKNTFSILPKGTNEMVFVFNEPVQALSYLPRQDGSHEGSILKYKVMVSDDNVRWTVAKEGEFSNIKSNPVLQFVDFEKEIYQKYIKLVATEFEGEKVTVAQINFYK